MNVLDGLFYAETHEWARKEEKEVIVGISDHAQSELSDVVFIELPKVGRTVKQGDPIVVIESVKAAYDIFSPVSGRVARVNVDLEKNPALINNDPYGKGWLFVLQDVREEDYEKLMDKSGYESLLKK